MDNLPNKGPWEVRPTPETLRGGDFQARIIAPGALFDGNDAIVVGCYTNRNGIGNIHWPPNAYLIAAAPDLLAACQAFNDFEKHVFDVPLTPERASEWLSCVEKCRAAIQKSLVPKEYSLPSETLISTLETMGKNTILNISIKSLFNVNSVELEQTLERAIGNAVWAAVSSIKSNPEKKNVKTYDMTPINESLSRISVSLKEVLTGLEERARREQQKESTSDKV